MEIVFDLDGTLSDTDAALPPDFDFDAPDWPAFYAAIPFAEPIRPMLGLLRSLLRDRRNRIEIWTARDEGAGGENRHATLRWLEVQAVRVASPAWARDAWQNLRSGEVVALRMRPFGDERPSEVLKAEWLADARAAGHGVDVVFEDREPLARMFRAAGVVVCQVASRDAPDRWAGS